MGDQSVALYQAEGLQNDKTNPFLIAATPLLTLMSQVRQCDSPPDIASLHTQIMHEVKAFVEKLKRLGFSSLMVDCACYCLCAALDEAILATSWGMASLWSESSLLSMYKSETLGGERFYIIADKLASEPRKNVFVLELVYILLSLGFEGRFYGKDKVLRDEIRAKLYQKIKMARGKIAKSLSVNWRDDKPIVKSVRHKNSIRRLITCTLLAIAILGVSYNIAAYRSTAPVISSLNKVGVESPVTAYSQLLNRSIFPKRYQ